MKKILLILLFVVSGLAHAWQQREPLPVSQCRIHSPYGFPQTTEVHPICRQAYLAGYDASSKIPKFVTYELLPRNALGCIVRSNAFVEDRSVPTSATPKDYVGTGYDKGHLAPSADMSWDTQVELESFLMTNMSAQHGSLNRGVWKLLETSIRGWSVQLNNSYTVIVGNIYNAKDKTIGNGVVVPHALYKIIINNQTDQVAAWRFPHVAPYPNLGNDLTRFRVPVAQLEQEANVKFSFPANAVEIQPGQEWPVDFGKLTDAKRTNCSKSKVTR